MTKVNRQKSNSTSESPLYHISFQRLAELNRSAANLVATRLTRSCPSKKTPIRKLADPQKLIDEISDHCANDESFIQSEMSLQEIVFRSLLIRRNRPTSLRELHHELTERWSTPTKPINMPEEMLYKILNTDTYYGLAQVSS
jgi:hypothetical protein